MSPRSSFFKSLKFFGITFLILAILSICLLFMLPTLISTPWGQSKFLSVVNGKIPGFISAKNIHLSWFGNQSISGFELKDSQKNSVLTVKTFFIDKNLLTLLWNGFSDSDIQLTDLNATIVETHSGTTNLHQALGLELTIEDTSIASVLENYRPLTIVLKNVNGQFHLPSSFSEPVTVHLSGITRQDEVEGNFDINISCAGIDIGQCFQTKQLTNFENAAVGIKAKITNFPVALLDQIITTKQPALAGLTRAALGKTLDLNFEKFLAHGEVQFKIDAKTPTLNSNLVGKLQSDTFTLDSNSVISLLITPEFFKILANKHQDILPAVRILNPVKSLLTINQLNVPIDFIRNTTGDASADLALSAIFEIDRINFASEGLFDATALQKVKVNIEAPKAIKTANFQIEAEAMKENKPFQINLNAKVDKPANLNALLDNVYHKADVEMDLAAIPMSFIDKILGIENLLADGSDERGALKIFAETTGNHADIRLSLQSNKLSIPYAHFKLNEQLTLAETATAQYRVNPAFVQQFIHDKSQIGLNNNALVELKLYQLTLPLSMLQAHEANPAISPESKHTYIDAELLSQPLSLTEAKWGTIEIRDFKLNIKGNPFDQTQCHMALNLLTPELNKPAHLELTIFPQKTPLNFHKLSEGDFSQLNLSGQLSCDEVSFKQDLSSKMPGMVIKKLLLPWELNANSNQIDFRLIGETQLVDKENIKGILKGDFRLINWLNEGKFDLANAEILAKTSTEKLPIILLEALLGRNDLVDFFGSTMDIQANADLRGSEQWKGTLDIALSTDGVKSNAALKIGNSITLMHPDQPATIEMTLTPKRFDILRNLLRKSTDNIDSVALLGVTKITGVINSLEIPWRGASSATTFDSMKAVSKMGIVANLAIEKFQVSNLNRKQQMAFENLTARFNSIALNQKISFQIATTETNHQTANDITVDGDIRNAFTDTGEINLANLSLNFEAKSKRLPASMFCQVACLEEDVRNKIEALFGEVLDTDIKVQLQQMNGLVQASILGSKGNISMDAQLTQGVLTLNKPVEAMFTVTPQLGKSILQDVIPILSGVISAENPIKISIDAKGLSVPLKPWDLSKVQLGQAVIDLGKMTFNNEGQLGTVFDLLKPSVNEKLTVWFTPIYLSMQEGMLKVKRMDLLMLDLYPMALWGKVDAVKEKIDLRIGLTGKALNQAFGIPGLDKEYMMQIPLKGKMGDASIDKSKAAARISALVAQSKGGSHGLLIGTLLEIAGGGLTEEQVPAPTTNPLPWSLTVQEQSASNSESSQSHNGFSHDESTSKTKKKSRSKSKQLQDGASFILDKFLR